MILHLELGTFNSITRRSLKPLFRIYSRVHSRHGAAMPPTTAVPRDHGSTLPNTLGGNTIVAIIISVIITVIAIGWLAYCFYTRHVGFGVSVDKDHLNEVPAGDGYIAVYTPRYTREGYKRPRREPLPPRSAGPHRIVVHRVPIQEHRYRMVRVLPQQKAQGADSPQEQKQKVNEKKSNAQQQQNQQNQNQGKKQQNQQNQNQGKNKHRGKKNKQKKNNNQNNQGNNQDSQGNQDWQGGSQDKSNEQNNQDNDKAWGENQPQGADWGTAEAHDTPQAEEEPQQENADWGAGGWGESGQNDDDLEGNDQGSSGQRSEQNENTDWNNVQIPNSPQAGATRGSGSVPGSWPGSNSGWKIDSHDKESSDKKNKKRNGKEAINDQTGWAAE